jgi:hypothetical protein
VPKVVDVLIRSGKANVRVLPTSSRWFGVTYPEDKQSVQENIRLLAASGEYPSRLWS